MFCTRTKLIRSLALEILNFSSEASNKIATLILFENDNI